MRYIPTPLLDSPLPFPLSHLNSLMWERQAGRKEDTNSFETRCANVLFYKASLVEVTFGGSSSQKFPGSAYAFCDTEEADIFASDLLSS